VALPAPPRNFSALQLDTVEVPATALHRVTWHDSGEPHFSTSGANRFDDPTRAKASRYGTCYFGLDLPTAMAETVLHDLVAKRGKFKVSYTEFAGRFLVRFQGPKLVLANLTDAPLKTLGGDGSISTELPPTMPQRWSRAVHQHPKHVDGILYKSRHLNARDAVCVFDRAKHKLETVGYVPLPRVQDALGATIVLRVSLQFP
jgi:RES domain